MKSEYVSLGSACDGASILDELGLRNASYPFDWLWNQDAGLDAVNHMIKSRFSALQSPDSYTSISHYRFERPVVAYRDYPTVVHMHSDPLHSAADHATLVRRYRRLLALFETQTQIHFIYYRNSVEDRIRSPEASLEASVVRLRSEVSEFTRMFEVSFPMTRFVILGVLETELSEVSEAHRLLRGCEPLDRRVLLTAVPARHDSNSGQRRAWKSQWKRALVEHSKMPRGIRTRIRLLGLVAAAGYHCRTLVARIRRKLKR